MTMVRPVFRYFFAFPTRVNLIQRTPSILYRYVKTLAPLTLYKLLLMAQKSREKLAAMKRKGE